MKKLIVADIMTRNPYFIGPESNLLDCAKIMVKKKVGSLIILSKSRLIGIISREDILWALVKKSPEELPLIKAIDISPKKIATTRPTAKINEVLRKMKKLKFERLPVVKKGEFLGILTIKDILSFHPELYSEIDEIDTIREESEKLKRVEDAKEREYYQEGICEECGEVDLLYKIDNILICDSCKSEF